MNKLIKFFAFLAVGVFLILFIIGTAWLAKNVSYWLWYDDMVQESVKEMVKEDCLRELP